MNHLNEEQLIDVLMEEQGWQRFQNHLDSCATCSGELDLLRTGLDAAHKVKPHMPLAAVPVISYDKFARHRKTIRQSWFAVAAILLLGILGLRVEMGGQGMVIQFALFNGGSTNTEMAQLESRLMNALELHSTMTQDQLDARFDAFYIDRDQEMGEFSQVMYKNLTNSNMEHEKKLIALQNELLRHDRNTNARGQLR